VVAEFLAEAGNKVSYVTPAGPCLGLDHHDQRAAAGAPSAQPPGRRGHDLNRVTAFDGETATLAQLFTGEETKIACKNLLIVGLRRPDDALYHALMERDPARRRIKSVSRVGDALAPGAIVHAVHSGHRYARELDEPVSEEPYKLDAPVVLD
jgi:dimethylamine/trimethylamine dehydrogenase